MQPNLRGLALAKQPDDNLPPCLRCGGPTRRIPSEPALLECTRCQCQRFEASPLNRKGGRS
jgi:hypothetical protein